MKTIYFLHARYSIGEVMIIHPGGYERDRALEIYRYGASIGEKERVVAELPFNTREDALAFQVEYLNYQNFKFGLPYDDQLLTEFVKLYPEMVIGS